MSIVYLADRIRIEGDGRGRGTVVLLDGERVHGVRSVSWKTGANEMPEVALTLVGHPEIDVMPNDPIEGDDAAT